MVATLREVPARLVPAGTPVTIPEGSFITITQSLGGNYTVTVNGNMARIDGTDADALGFEREELSFAPVNDDQVHEDQVWQALQTIYDPEIPVDIVNLGLIYKVRIEGNVVHIDMTLTAPGCGMGSVLVSDIEYRVAKVPNVEKVQVELVFDPAWNRDMMSDEAKLETGMFF